MPPDHSADAHGYTSDHRDEVAPEHGTGGSGSASEQLPLTLSTVVAAHKKLSAERLTLRAAGLTRSSCLAAFLLAGAICAREVFFADQRRY